ncbi:MAG: type I methionyl aminopeptidase [Bacteroidota bacterium]
MILVKGEHEISLIRAAANILSKTLGLMAQEIKPGVTTKKLDRLAEEFINDQGGKPAFKGFEKFPASLCASINEVAAHGIPTHHPLREGDIVAIDCGVTYQGFYSDAAFTFPVGMVSQEASNLLRITKGALYKGIKQASAGKRTGDIGQAIQEHAHKHGCSVIRILAGHGIGRDLHEAPDIPNYGKQGRGIKLKPGMVLAIEPMINLGGSAVVQESDGWAIRTLDRKLSAHFEHTIALRIHNTEILTTYQYIEEASQT